MFDYLIVGAGLFGSTFAWRARQAGKSVLVVERRDHIGGNCYTYDEGGIQVHAYGPHIFHTSDEGIWNFVNRFANFRPYLHRVKAINGNRVLSMPINLMTMHQIWGVTSPDQAQRRLEQEVVPCKSPANLEEWALSQVGPELYRLLIRDYTAKQWGRDPKQLPASILRRLPIRTTWDDNYYADTYQGIPVGGYTQIFERLLEGCEVRLGVDFLSERATLSSLATKVVFTGPIDAYFDHKFGRLEYRTLDFKTRTLGEPDFQGLAQLNCTSLDVPYTRIIEHKHFEPVNTPHTVVTWERPVPWFEGATPYYPINDAANNALYERYRRLARGRPDVLFGGRLASYKYRDMHQVIAEAHHLANQEGLAWK